MALGTGQSSVLACGWEQQVPVVRTADTQSGSAQYVMYFPKEYFLPAHNMCPEEQFRWCCSSKGGFLPTRCVCNTPLKNTDTHLMT